MNRDNDQIRALRLSYERGELNRKDIADDPFDLFQLWFDEAVDAEVLEANAVQLASVNQAGQPTLRTVLIKEIQPEGYVFYTNFESRKGQELTQNPKASFLIFWKELERQIRVEGVVEKISAEHSTEYYHSRPKGSQIGAWASPQSKIIDDRQILDNAVEKLTAKHIDDDRLPKPPHWGGYILKPNYFEFWQGRKNRLHDRFEYREEGGNWQINRLAP